MTKIEINGFRNTLKKKLAELEQNENNGRGGLAIETSADELRPHSGRPRARSSN
jgi:hypothetical protein